MCTLTVVPGRMLAEESELRPSFRLVFSRDERRTRRVAGPPRSIHIEGRHVLMPIDTESGGTWLAASDAGLAFALLNVTAYISPGTVSVAPAWPGRASRGTLIPAVSGAPDLAGVLDRLGRIDPAAYGPFHLVVIAGDERLDARSNRAQFDVRPSRTRDAWMRTSSGLGDRRAIAPRRRLFETWFRRPPYTRHAQDAFHRHRWEAHPALSVAMERPDARTVSIATVEVEPGRVQMDYLMV